MGLDCYVRADFDNQGETDTEELWYGRKENEIHGWMQRKSGIDADSFNCRELPLDEITLHQFESAMKLGLLTPTGGFFFGSGNDQEDVKSAAQELLDAARSSLAEGGKPYYSSWW